MPPLTLTFLTDVAPFVYAASTSAVVGLGTWLLWRFGWLQGFLALFVRVDPGAAGTHLVRAAALEELHKNRVVSTDELGERLGINRGTLLWHLRLLERLDVVRSRRVGRSRVWYRKDAGAPRLEELLVEDAPHRRSILAAIAQRPGLSLSELSRATGLAKSSVHRHVAKLATAGVVQLRRKALRTCLYRAAAP